MKLREDYGKEWSQEGDIAFVENKLSLAHKAFIEAAKYIPNNPYILFKLGRTLDAMERHDESQIYFNQALKIKPDLTEERFVKLDNELRIKLGLEQENKTNKKTNTTKKSKPADKIISSTKKSKPTDKKNNSTTKKY